MLVTGWQLDLVTFVVFSNLNGAMILFFYTLLCLLYPVLHHVVLPAETLQNRSQHSTAMMVTVLNIQSRL